MVGFLNDRPLKFEKHFTVDDMKEALFEKGVYRVQSDLPEDNLDFKQLSVYLTRGVYSIVHENSRKGNKILNKAKSFHEIVEYFGKLGFSDKK